MSDKNEDFHAINLAEISRQVEGITRKIDCYGRMSSLPHAYRKSMGLLPDGGPVKVILLKEGVLVVPLHKMEKK